MPHRSTARPRTRGQPAALVTGVGVVVVVLILLAPVVIGPVRLVGSAFARGEGVLAEVIASFTSPALVSAAWAVGVITLIAVALGWAIGRAMARGGWWSAVLLLPPLLPSYLAYAGSNALRGPGTPAGDWLALLAQDGHRWAPVFAGRALAVIALGLWAAPIAGLLVARGLRAMGDVDALARLDGAPWWRRELQLLRACRSSLLASAVLVGVIMLGSAVPLHVAQLQTPAIRAWRLLAEVSPESWWRAWASVTPGALVSLAVAALVVRGVAAWRPAEAGETPRAGAVALLAWLGVALALLAPTIALGATVRDVEVVRTFWSLHAGALGWSVATAAIAAGGAMVVCLLAAHAASDGGRFLRASLLMLLALSVWVALLPGVLVGASVAQLGLSEGSGAVLHAAGARFVAFPLLVGLLLALSEEAATRDARRLDAPGSVVGSALTWLLAAMPGHARGVLGAGLVVGVLTLHEIEASVVVQPIGVRGMPRVLLDALHFARDDELAAGVLGLLLAAVAVALPAAWAIRPRAHRNRRHNPRAGQPIIGPPGTG
ncbi:MAG: hypothetical protein AAF356_06170 [Planctomycetota bacterium]